jgi:hypothetical protein
MKSPEESSVMEIGKVFFADFRPLVNMFSGMPVLNPDHFTYYCFIKQWSSEPTSKTGEDQRSFQYLTIK